MSSYSIYPRVPCTLALRSTSPPCEKCDKDGAPLFISIFSRAWRNQRHIHRLKLKFWLVGIGRKVRLRRFEPVLIIAFGDVRLVMRPARFVSHARPLRNHPR